MSSDTSPSVSEQLRQASALRDAGELGAAEDLYKAILKSDPQNAAAQKSLHRLRKSTKKPARIKKQKTKRKDAPLKTPEAPVVHLQPSDRDIEELMALHRGGRLEEAEKRARKLIKIYPGVPVLYDLLGGALAVQGKFEEAVACFRQVLKSIPDYAEAHSNLGTALKALGHLEEAAASYGRALELNPNLAKTHVSLGLVLKRLGRLEEAAACYRRALATSPDFAQAHTNLGVALMEIGKTEEALACHRRALEIRPGYAHAHTNLGSALADLGRNEEAIASHLRALEIVPDFGEAHTHLAYLYELSNDLERAAEHSERALALIPDDLEANVIQARLLRRGGDIKKAIAMLEPLAHKSIPVRSVAAVNYELGMLFDRAAEYDKAFYHFVRGNELQAQIDLPTVSGKEAFLSAVRDMETVLTPDSVSGWTTATEPDDSDVPAFLVGFPRSGTTLLDQILDSHPGIQVMEEKGAVQDVMRHVIRTFGDFPASMAGMTTEDIRGLRDVYFESVGGYIEREPGTLLIDKLPLNICNIPLIFRLFPKAKIIIALRHPCDVVLSNFMQRYGINDAMANFLTIEDAAHCYSQVMGLWRKCQAVLPLTHYTIRYESLVADLEGEVRRLLAFLDVGWEDAVLDYAQHARQKGRIFTPSYQSVTEPVYQRAKYRWKHYEAQLKPVLRVLSPYIEAFGYSEAERA